MVVLHSTVLAPGGTGFSGLVPAGSAFEWLSDKTMIPQPNTKSSILMVD
jgi:hypothetical protein